MQSFSQLFLYWKIEEYFCNYDSNGMLYDKTLWYSRAIKAQFYFSLICILVAEVHRTSKHMHKICLHFTNLLFLFLIFYFNKDPERSWKYNIGKMSVFD